MGKYQVVDPKDVTINYVKIWERWEKRDGVVYYEWKRPEDTEWHSEKTAYTDSPVVMGKMLTPEQYDTKVRNGDIK